jgi:rubrerythrin
MKIIVCPACGKKASFRDELAGKNLKCPCGKTFQAPLKTNPATELPPSVSITSSPTSGNKHDGYNPQLEKLISIALKDGVITDKERQILIKKAVEFGVDPDEFEMEIESRIPEKSTDKLVYYYNKNNLRNGPVSLENLRLLASSGQLIETDLVWCYGMPSWTASNKIQELQNIFPPSVPNHQENSPSSTNILDAKVAMVWPESMEALKTRTTESTNHLTSTSNSTSNAKTQNSENYGKFFTSQNTTTNFDGCGPCTNCGYIFQMQFTNALCPKCKRKMSRDDAFFSCANHPYSMPPNTISPPPEEIKKTKAEESQRPLAVSLEEANKLFGLHKYHEGIAELTKIVQLHPNLAAVYFQRGCFYYALAQSKLKETQLNKNESSPDSLLELSKKAQADFHKTDTLDPNFISLESRKLVESNSKQITTLENERGSVFSDIWNFVSGKWKCPKCSYRKTKELSRKINEVTEWKRDSSYRDSIMYSRDIWYTCEIYCTWCNNNYTDITYKTELDKRSL